MSETDEVRHARRVHPRHVRHVVAGLPDVHRRRCTTASAACTRRSATPAPTRSSASCSPATTRAPGTSRTRRCRRRCGRSATTTTTRRPGLLTALSYFSGNTKLFLKNFYLKSKRSIVKPNDRRAGRLRASGRRPAARARRRSCCAMLQRQAVEISRATAPFTVTMPVKKAKAEREGAPNVRRTAADEAAEARRRRRPTRSRRPRRRQFPAGSYIIRMDQPYSRIADALLDYQYWSPNDPQKRPYDDTGLDLRRAVQRAGGAGDRREGARRRRWRG